MSKNSLKTMGVSAFPPIGCRKDSDYIRSGHESDIDFFMEDDVDFLIQDDQFHDPYC